MTRFASTYYTSVKQLKHSLVPRSVICLPCGPPPFLKLLTATYQGGKQYVRGEVNLLPQVYEHYLCTDSSKGLVLDVEYNKKREAFASPLLVFS